MNAKEMFEELGYVKENEDKDGFDWRHKEINYLVYSFSLEDKTVMPSNMYTIDMSDLKAIYQQCKELGWIDEH